MERNAMWAEEEGIVPPGMGHMAQRLAGAHEWLDAVFGPSTTRRVVVMHGDMGSYMAGDFEEGEEYEGEEDGEEWTEEEEEEEEEGEEDEGEEEEDEEEDEGEGESDEEGSASVSG